ncbi:MAG: hypothetical protein WC376_00970 [Candidatus Nanoarchaeia archaeon]|jgi:hypothetical protein
MSYKEKLRYLVKNYIKRDGYPNKNKAYDFGIKKINELLNSQKCINEQIYNEINEVFTNKYFSLSGFQRAVEISKHMIYYDSENKTIDLKEGFYIVYLHEKNRINSLITCTDLRALPDFYRAYSLKELSPPIGILKQGLELTLMEVIAKMYP